MARHKGETQGKDTRAASGRLTRHVTLILSHAVASSETSTSTLNSGFKRDPTAAQRQWRMSRPWRSINDTLTDHDQSVSAVFYVEGLPRMKQPEIVVLSSYHLGSPRGALSHKRFDSTPAISPCSENLSWQRLSCQTSWQRLGVCGRGFLSRTHHRSVQAWWRRLRSCERTCVRLGSPAPAPRTWCWPPARPACGTSCRWTPRLS